MWKLGVIRVQLRKDRLSSILVLAHVSLVFLIGCLEKQFLSLLNASLGDEREAIVICGGSRHGISIPVLRRVCQTIWYHICIPTVVVINEWIQSRQPQGNPRVGFRESSNVGWVSVVLCLWEQRGEWSIVSVKQKFEVSFLSKLW